MRIAATMPGSVQVPMAATWARSARSVRADSAPRRPSAIVCGCGIACSVPDAKLRAASSAPAGSAPNTVMPGNTPRAAIAVPDSRPPPPTGATTTSRSGTASSSSSVAVPWPAMTAQSSYGCTSVAPVARPTSAHIASRAASVGAQKCTCAPKPCTFATLIFGAFSGITTCAGMPRCRAAYASAAP